MLRRRVRTVADRLPVNS